MSVNPYEAPQAEEEQHKPALRLLIRSAATGVFPFACVSAWFALSVVIFRTVIWKDVGWLDWTKAAALFSCALLSGISAACALLSGISAAMLASGVAQVITGKWSTSE